MGMLNATSFFELQLIESAGYQTLWQKLPLDMVAVVLSLGA
jgi:hypothetical protein